MHSRLMHTHFFMDHVFNLCSMTHAPARTHAMSMHPPLGVDILATVERAPHLLVA